MSSSSELPPLDNHHRNTPRRIFRHPASHIEWHAVLGQAGYSAP